MPKEQNLKDSKQAAKAGDRHNIAGPAQDGAAWARTVTTKRVADLFKTLNGLPGHWTQLQQEISRGNNHFVANGKTSPDGKKLITFIADAVIAAAKKAQFDFPRQELKFTSDMGWLKLARERGQVKVSSKP